MDTVIQESKTGELSKKALYVLVMITVIVGSISTWVIYDSMSTVITKDASGNAGVISLQILKNPDLNKGKISLSIENPQISEAQ